MKSFEAYKEILESYIQKEIPKISPKELYEPYLYLIDLPSKRIRPVMLMSVYECYRPLENHVLNCAMAIEFFHNFTLMHDDIMDASDTRRGLPTVHKKFNENSAILSGDVLLIITYQLLENLLETKYFKEIFKLYNHTAIQICSGQQLDMNFENEYTITELEYLMMIEYKTAVLLATSFKIGAILGEATPQDADAFYQFGLNIGMAFQIQDDLLDSFGSTEQTGKVVGGDICNNKKTLLMIKALQSNNRYHKELLNNWLQTKSFDEQKVTDIKQIFKDSGALDYTIQKRDAYCEKAISFLNKINIQHEDKEALIQFAKKSIQRVS